MSVKWTVKDGTQVNHGGKLHEPGDTFSATEEELTGLGVLGYVTKADESHVAENKAQAAPKPSDAKAGEAPRK